MLVNYQKHNVIVGTRIMRGILKGSWKADEAFVNFLIDRPAVLRVLLKTLVQNIEAHMPRETVVKLVEGAAEVLKIGSDVINTVLTMKDPPQTLIMDVREFMEDGGLSGLTLRVVLKRWARVHELSIIPTEKLMSTVLRGHMFTLDNVDVLYRFMTGLTREELKSVNEKDVNTFVERFIKLDIMKGFDVCVSVVQKVPYANLEICGFMCRETTRAWRAEWCEAFAVITQHVPHDMREKLFEIAGEDLDNEIKYGHISHADGRKQIQSIPQDELVPVDTALLNAVPSLSCGVSPQPKGGLVPTSISMFKGISQIRESKPLVGWREISQLIELLPVSEASLGRMKAAMEVHGKALVKQCGRLLAKYADKDIIAFIDWLQSRDAASQVMAMDVICTIVSTGNHSMLFNKFLGKISDVLTKDDIHPSVRSKAIRCVPVMQEHMPAESAYPMSTVLDIIRQVNGTDELEAKKDIGQDYIALSSYRNSYTRRQPCVIGGIPVRIESLGSGGTLISLVSCRLIFRNVSFQRSLDHIIYE